MIAGSPSFPRFFQLDNYSCGSRCVQAILKHFDLPRSHRILKEALRTTPDGGTPVHEIVRVLRRNHFRVGCRRALSLRGLLAAFRLGRVALVHLDGDHFAVAHAATERRVLLSDPSVIRCPGRSQPRRLFLARWKSRWALLVWPAPSTRRHKKERSS